MPDPQLAGVPEVLRAQLRRLGAEYVSAEEFAGLSAAEFLDRMGRWPQVVMDESAQRAEHVVFSVQHFDQTCAALRAIVKDDLAYEQRRLSERSLTELCDLVDALRSWHPSRRKASDTLAVTGGGSHG